MFYMYPSFASTSSLLTSLSKDLHCSMNFNFNGCFVQKYLMKKLLLLGRAKNALYFLLDSNLNQYSKGIKYHKVATVSNVHFLNNNDGRHLHLRMGHLPFQKLYFLFPYLKINAIYKECLCIIRPLAKKARDPFPRRKIKQLRLSNC